MKAELEDLTNRSSDKDALIESLQDSLHAHMEMQEQLATPACPHCPALQEKIQVRAPAGRCNTRNQLDWLAL